MKRLLFPACAVLSFLLACAGEALPTEPVWGKQACDSCKMILSDPRSAAELVDDRGQRRFFDDIGCLAEYLDAHPQKMRGVWVRSGERWVEASGARFASGATTPMDYGFTASASGSLDFSQVRRAAADRRARSAR